MKHKIEAIKVNKLDLFLGVVILTLSSIGYYAFFYMSRECIRCFSITTDYDIWLLSDVEVRFYNTFFAFVALIMGVSSAMNLIIERPHQFSRARTIRSAITNDLRVLNWVFISWASKLGVVFGIFFCSYQGYYTFSLFPDYIYLFVLFGVVLFLQLWTNIFRYFNVAFLKILLIVGMFLVFGSLILGSVNFIDYNKINQKVLKNNVYHNYELIKPEAENWIYYRRYSTTTQLYIVNKKSELTDEPVFIYDNREIEPSELRLLIEKWRMLISETQRPAMLVQLNINHRVQMRYVNEVRHELVESGISKVGYSVVPVDLDGDPQQYKRCVIIKRLFDYKRLWGINDEFLGKMDTINIQLSLGQISVDNKPVPKSELKVSLISLIKNKPNCFIRMKYSDSISYSEFLEIYALITESVTKVRNQYSLSKYGRELDSCDKVQKRDIRDKYPLYLEDVNFKLTFNEKEPF